MELHFYTSFSNLEKFEDGDVINVWNKVEAEPTDVHISINNEECILDKVSNTVFQVRKVTWTVG